MQHFRKRMIVGPALTGKARGPLVYSGSEFALIKTPGGVATKGWRVIFWFWVPPGQRQPRQFQTEVKDARPFELAALACGELEEVAFNITWPIDMKTADAARLLEADYNRRIHARLGFVPDGASALTVNPTRETSAILLG